MCWLQTSPLVHDFARILFSFFSCSTLLSSSVFGFK